MSTSAGAAAWEDDVDSLPRQFMGPAVLVIACLHLAMSLLLGYLALDTLMEKWSLSQSDFFRVCCSLVGFGIFLVQIPAVFGLLLRLPWSYKFIRSTMNAALLLLLVPPLVWIYRSEMPLNPGLIFYFYVTLAAWPIAMVFFLGRRSIEEYFDADRQAGALEDSSTRDASQTMEEFHMSFPPVLRFYAAVMVGAGIAWLYLLGSVRVPAFVITLMIILVIGRVYARWFVSSYKVFVSSSAIQCKDFWLENHTVSWSSITHVRPTMFCGLKFLRVWSSEIPRPIWVPTCLIDMSRFVQLVTTHAGRDHILAEQLKNTGK